MTIEDLAQDLPDRSTDWKTLLNLTDVVAALVLIADRIERQTDAIEKLTDVIERLE
jgi:hypothetical protein